MSSIGSSTASHVGNRHPLDSDDVQQNLLAFQASMEKVRKMNPVTVYCVSWNLPDRDTEYYSVKEDAKRNYSEHHSTIDPVKAVQDEYGNIFLVTLKAAVKTKAIEVYDRTVELQRERKDLKKRKRAIDEELQVLASASLPAIKGIERELGETEE